MHKPQSNPFAHISSEPKQEPVVRPLVTDSALKVMSKEQALAEALEFYKFGLGNGETTHWPVLDDNWKWLKQEITVVTGYPNHGKSRMVHHLMLIKAALKGWKFACYVAENESDFYVEMAQMLVGRTANVKCGHNRMTLADLENAVNWLSDHFFVVQAPEGATVKQLLDAFAKLHLTTPLDGVLVDPFNQLSHSFTREDVYLSEQFSNLKRFAIHHNLAVFVTAHPAGTVKDKNGTLIRPDAYSISGGKMWNNKFDNVMAVFRPDFPDPATELWIHKIKKQGRVGMPGMLKLTFDKEQFRYFPDLDQSSHPLQDVSFNAPGEKKSDHDFPESDFEKPLPEQADAPF